MKKLLLLILSSVVFHCAISQDTFDIVFENPFLSTGSSDGLKIEIVDDTLFVFGLVVQEDATTNASILKHNLTGGLLNTTVIDPDSLNLSSNLGRWGAVDYTPASDTGFFTIPYSEFDNSIDFSSKYLMTLNQNGEETSRYPLDWDDRFGYNIYQSRSHNLYEHFFCGPSWDSTGLHSLTDNGFLLKTNEFGETLWSHTYEDVFMFRFMDLMEDGGILLGGYIYYGGTLGANNTSDDIIIRTDSMGIEQWRYVLVSDGGIAYCPVIEASDGTIVTVSIDGSVHNGASGLNEGPFWFQRIQDNGDSYEVLDEGSYGDHILYDNVPYDLKETSDGGFVVCGTGEAYDEDEFDSHIAGGVLLKVDENLDSLWYRHYQHFIDEEDALHYFYNMTITEDDCFYITGKAERGELTGLNGLGHIWLVKLDSLGCLEPGCNEVGVETIVIGLQNSMKVFPNPVQNQLQIEFTLPSNFNPKDGNSLLIIDSQGRNVGTYYLDDYFHDSYVKQIDVSSLSSGLYTAHWIGDDGRKLFDSTRIVKSEK